MQRSGQPSYLPGFFHLETSPRFPIRPNTIVLLIITYVLRNSLKRLYPGVFQLKEFPLPSLDNCFVYVYNELCVKSDAKGEKAKKGVMAFSASAHPLSI